MSSYSEQLAQWIHSCRFEDVPTDIAEATRLRILDIMGLVLAATTTGFGASVRHATTALSPVGPSHLIGTGEAVGITAAAFANGAMAQALEFDDTHNESIVHMSAPSVAAALALSESRLISGRELITAIAVGNEVSCRIGSVAPGQLHRRGFHPTGLFAPFGAACLAGRLLDLKPKQLASAVGVVGSFASGILECWVDGTQAKFLHPGWAAQSGIAAAFLASAGVTGPNTVFEGRFGLLRSHLQNADVVLDFARISEGLGITWESRRASFKPFPTAHVIHPYIDALLRLRRQYGIDPANVRKIVCNVASFIVPIVCEPVAEKRRPKSDSHGRVSLQYTLAEALFFGRLGRDAYHQTSLENPAILDLADRISYRIDPAFPGPEQFKGALKVTLTNGLSYEAVEEHNRGSAENPLSPDEIIAKFDENAASVLSLAQRERLITAVVALGSSADASALVRLSIRH